MIRNAPQMAARLAPLALIALSAVPMANTTRAADFRIHTKMYANAGTTPEGENITIFHDGLVYDFCEDPVEAVVFDPAGRRFVLLESRRQQLAEISLEQIDTLLPALRQKLAERGDEFSTFLAKPEFRTVTGDRPGEANFVAAWMHYHVQASTAPSDAVAAQYAAFSFHYTRLNALRRPPLLARAAVNDWLKERKLIPQSVHLATFSKNEAGEMVPEAEFRSEHVVSWELAPGDLERLTKLAQWQADYKRVSLAAYWSVAEPGNQ